jgi:hypothetical protein
MKTDFTVLKGFRVFRHLSILGIFNHLICNRIMKSKTLVSYAPNIYKISCIFPGKTITNLFISSTFNKMFTGGNTLTDVKNTTKHF